MEWSQVEARWKQVRCEIKVKWIRLSDDDLESIGGRRERLEHKIQQRYGFATAHVRREVEEWLRWQRPISRRMRKTNLVSRRMKREKNDADRSLTAILLSQQGP